MTVSVKPISDLSIPPEALEAGARAMCLHPDLIVDNHTPTCPGPAWRLYVEDARAAFLAMIEAWPGMWNEQENGSKVLFDGTPNLILPLTETHDDKA